MDVYVWARRAVPVFKTNTRKMRLAGVNLAVGTEAGGPVGYNLQGSYTPCCAKLTAAPTSGRTRHRSNPGGAPCPPS